MYLGDLIEFGRHRADLHQARAGRRPRTTSPAGSAEAAGRRIQEHACRQASVHASSTPSSSGISTRVLEMGGLVESQIAQAIYALTQFSSDVADAGDRRPRSASTRWKSRSTASFDHHRAPPADRARPAPADRDLEDDREPRARRRRGGADRAHGAAPDQSERLEPAARCRSTSCASRRSWRRACCARRSTRSRGSTSIAAVAGAEARTT